MTLRDFVLLLGRHWKLCVILPVVCALACAGYLFLQAKDVNYYANAYIVSGNTAQVAAINGAASSAARELLADEPDYIMTPKSDNVALTVTITVSGPDEAKVVDLANDIANTAVKDASGLFTEETPLYANVQLVVSGTQKPASSPLPYVLLALIAGFFVALCITLGVDAVRNPIRSTSDLAEASKLPVLGELPADGGARLLANARFASEKDGIRTVLVVPVKEIGSAELVCELVNQAAREEDPAAAQARGGSVNASACAPLQQGIDGVYEAREADAVVIAAVQWTDLSKDVQSTIDELKLANAKTIGCVLVGPKELANLKARH